MSLRISILALPLLLTIACRSAEPPEDSGGDGDGDGDNSASGGASSGNGGSPVSGGGPGAGGTATGDGGLGGEGNSGGADPSSGGSTATGGGDAVLDNGPMQEKLAAVEVACSVLDMETDCNETTPAPCIGEDGKISCSLKIFDGEGASVYDGRVGIERRGRSSLNFPKPNYAIEFRKSDGSDNPKGCLGMGKEADWILNGDWADRSLIRNSLAYDLFDDMGAETHYGPESRFATLSLNGNPQGIYRLSERIKIDDDRVNIPPDTGAGTSMVLKLDNESEDVTADLGFLTDAWQIVSPNPSNVTHRAVALSWLNNLADALDDGTMFEHLNLENVVDWVLLQEFAKNIDAYQLSIFFSWTNGETANLIPWDLDLAFGQPTSELNVGNDSPEGWLTTRSTFIENILQNETFQNRLVERWAELRANRFSDASLNRRIDQYLVVLSGAAIDENFSVWPIEEVDFTPIYDDYSLYPIDSHAAEVDKVRAWILARLAWMDANIETL